MDLIPSLLSGVAGFFLGMILTSRVVAWLQMLEVSLKSNPESRSRSLFMTGVLHSGPWFLLGTVWAAYFVLSKPYSNEWLAFFVGIAIAPLVLIPTAIVISLRKKKAQTTNAA
jgi:hypothetical protein